MGELLKIGVRRIQARDNSASRDAQSSWLDRVSRVWRSARDPGLGGKVGRTPGSKLVNYTSTYL